MFGVSAPVSAVSHDMEVHVDAVDPEADVDEVEGPDKDAEGAEVDAEELLAMGRLDSWSGGGEWIAKSS